MTECEQLLDEILQHLRNHEIELAEKKLSKMDLIKLSRKDPCCKNGILIYKASIEELKDNFHEALDLFQSAKQFAIEYDIIIQQITSNLGLGRIHHELGNLQSAEQFYQQALDIAKSNNKEEEIIGILINIGIIHAESGNYYKSENSFKEAQENNQKNKDINKSILIIVNLIDLYNNMYRYSDINKKLKEFNILYKENPKEYYLISICKSQAESAFKRANYDLSIKNYNRAYKITKDKNDIDLMIESLIGLSKCYIEIENWNKVEKCIALIKKIDNISSMEIEYARYNSIYGLYYLKKGLYEKAEKQLIISLNILENKELKKYLTDIYFYFGELFYKKRMYKEAIEYFDKTIKNAMIYTDKLNLSKSYFYLSFIDQIKNIDNITNYKKGLDIAKSIENNIIIKFAENEIKNIKINYNSYNENCN